MGVAAVLVRCPRGAVTPASAAIQKGCGGGDPRGCAGFLVPQDAGQGLDRDSGMAAGQRANFGGSTWQVSLALKGWRRPVGWSGAGLLTAKKTRDRFPGAGI
jgi:hypothetical protein